MSVLIDLSVGVICFMSNCYPILFGDSTPTGEFDLKHFKASQFYGGDILVFQETADSLFAIHRVIDVPGQDRLNRIKDPNISQRKITGGCINVDEVVYSELIECCSTSKLVVK